MSATATLSPETTKCSVCQKDISISLTDYCGQCDAITCPDCDCGCVPMEIPMGDYIPPQA